MKKIWMIFCFSLLFCSTVFFGYGMDGVVNVSVCTGIGEADIISVWAGCKSISCVCQGSS